MAEASRVEKWVIAGTGAAVFAVAAAGMVIARTGSRNLFAEGPCDYALPTYDLSRDPVVGSPLPIPEKGQVPRGSAKERVLAAVAGSCTGCAVAHLAPLLEAEGRVDRIAVTLVGRKEDVPKEFRNLPPKFSVICDSNASLADRLNAVWAPRYYVCNGALQLICLQQYPEETLRQLLTKAGC